MSKHLQMEKSPVPVYQKGADYKGIIANVTAADYQQVGGKNALNRFPVPVVHQPSVRANRLLSPLWKYMERQNHGQIPAVELKLKNGQHIIVARPKYLPAYVAPRKSVALRAGVQAA